VFEGQDIKGEKKLVFKELSSSKWSIPTPDMFQKVKGQNYSQDHQRSKECYLQMNAAPSSHSFKIPSISRHEMLKRGDIRQPEETKNY
jgi:hypothetical protein